jgi:hypothetical protein
VRFFGWAIVVKSSDGRLLGVKQGVCIADTDDTTGMETQAIAFARTTMPGVHTIISDCASAKGYDVLADKDDPFHQIAHFASRDALYTRLVTAGHSFKGRNKTAAEKMARALARVEETVLP